MVCLFEGSDEELPKPSAPSGPQHMRREREDPLALIRLVSNQQRSLHDKLGGLDGLLGEAIEALSARLDSMEAKIGAVYASLAPAGDTEQRIAELRAELDVVNTRTKEREESAEAEVAGHRKAIVAALQALGAPPPRTPPNILTTTAALPPVLPRSTQAAQQPTAPPVPVALTAPAKELPKFASREGIRRSRT